MPFLTRDETALHIFRHLFRPFACFFSWRKRGTSFLPGKGRGQSVFVSHKDLSQMIIKSIEAPSNLLVENVTVTGADLSWEEVANASNGYTWVIMLDGEDPTDTANTPVATGTTAMGVLTASVSGLTENTEYDAYVSADCGDTDGMSDFSDVESCFF